MADQVVTRFKSVKLHHHWPCTVCGGHTGGVNVLNESEDGAVRVCEHCLKENAIDARLALHAHRYLRRHLVTARCHGWNPPL